MHSLLENYLSEVAAHLNALPVKQRNEELREMRAHLENAVIVSRELGQTEEEAVQNIIAQFGTPQDLGENVVWAWRRGKKLNRRSFWTATGCTFALLFLMPLLPVVLPFAPWGATSGSGLSTLFAGAVCGGFFSKRGLAGTAFGLALYYYVFSAGTFAYASSLPELQRLMEPLWHTAGLFFVQQSEAAWLTLLIAWAVNRWRLKRIDKAYLTQG